MHFCPTGYALLLRFNLTHVVSTPFSGCNLDSRADDGSLVHHHRRHHQVAPDALQSLHGA